MNIKYSTSRTVAGVATFVLAWSLAACSADELDLATSPSPTAESTSEPAPTAEGQNDADVQVELGEEFDDVPLPQDYEVMEASGADDQGTSTARVRVPSNWEDTSTYYREQLPVTGWTVDTEQPVAQGNGTTFTTSRDSANGTFTVTEDGDGSVVDMSVTPATTTTADTNEGAADDLGGAGGPELLTTEMPAGFPDIGLPVYDPSLMVAGGDHGDGMWVLEYVTDADRTLVTETLEQQAQARGWHIDSHAPEGDMEVFEISQGATTVTMVVAPERLDPGLTAIHYTVRTQ